VLDFARRWLFPVVCLGCGRPDVALCAGCRPPAELQFRFSLDHLAVTAIAPYTGLWRRAIVAMKSGERAYLEAFAETLRERAPQRSMIVPVPTTRRRIAARGFDQVGEIAGRWAGSRVVPALRKVAGRPQHGLPRAGRLSLRGRFAVAEPARLERGEAVLFDDVCTTGATLRDAAHALRSAGVRVAGAIVLAAPSRNAFEIPAYRMGTGGNL
jgi:predicted amidophosphoribosyltransferase